jgi:two-component system, NarL family, sensor histidine kinase BarA
MFNYFKNISLKNSLILLWLLPLTFVSLTLGIYIINQRIIDINDATNDKQLSILRYLTESSGYAMYTNNTQVLTNIADSLKTGNDIVGTILYDKNTNLVVSSKNINANDFSLDNIINNYPPEKKFMLNDQCIMYKTIVTHWVADTEPLHTNEFNSSSSKILGHAFLVISEDYIKDKQNNIMITGVSICIAGLLIAFMFTFYFSRKLSTIFSTVSDSIQKLKNGDYKISLPDNIEGETGELYTGIQNLARQLHNHNAEMSYNITVATTKLQQTLARLEAQKNELILAREKAELANNSKDNFLAKMSHELRTPVNAITGFATLIKRRSSNKEDREQSDIIITSSNILLSIIDELLDYSKIELGEIKLQNMAFNLTQCAKNVFQMNLDNAHAKKLEIELNQSTQSSVIVYGDEYKLFQILNNLVANSIKYTETGTININIKDSNENKYNTEIIVSDTGVGIPEDMLTTIFDPFVQLNKEFNVNSSSAGLGLSIVKKLVDMMNGIIEIKSTEGIGTTITLLFQFKPADTDENVIAINTSSLINQELVLFFDITSNVFNEFDDMCYLHATNFTELEKIVELHAPSIIIVNIENKQATIDWLNELLTRTVFKYHCSFIFIVENNNELPIELLKKQLKFEVIYKPVSKSSIQKATSKLIEEDKNNFTGILSTKINNSKVLIAEDHDFNRLLLINLLNQYNCETYEAKDGQELMYLLPEVRPDLILLDIHMPNISGFDACEKIRKLDDKIKNTPIILMTADIITMNSDDLDKIGADDIIYKPIEANILFSKIDKVLNEADKSIHLSITETNPKHFNSSIERATLFEEFKNLTNKITDSLDKNDLGKTKIYSHKLKGIAGLSKNLIFINEVEKLNGSLSIAQYSESLSQISKIIANESSS